MKKQTPGLSNAYALSTPEDSRRLYADWAGSYDQDFAAGQDYLLPGLTAKAFAAAGGTGPVLDAGAGTGLCGQALRALGIEPIDATDISAAMLAEALRKDAYRDVIEADLLQGIPVPRGSYRGVVSSGTFTHGHLGPEVLPALLRVAAPGAWFALSVNTKFYEKAGFADALDRLLQGQWIKSLTLPELRIYGPRATGAHKDDTALIALFQKV
ncbi:class I SAM-dependent methyltransferase [Leisingera sp. ANG59]|uniref:class I SAM-dependent DNA methyltransferase n=1 Tax=Leisingera sp. ANG59 TaxID=2675221 RepID=UPI001574A0CB|nr:class I SAM-dependent methyltransferase [Leisingera sp. ANG59]NSY37334.1 methyltransferase domain-containing protein [Leisingera sp. ANG59]